MESLLLLFVADSTCNEASSLNDGAQHLRLNSIRMYQTQSTIASSQRKQQIRYVEKRGSETPTRPAEQIYRVIMNLIVPLAFLVSTTLATLSCEAGTTYVSITKKCTDAANEESYQILRESTVLVSSAPFAWNEQRTNEYCLSASTNDMYELKLKDSYGDSWSGGAWVSVAGEYGNIVFKNYMTADSEESYALSLHYPLRKAQEWRFFDSTTTIASEWTQTAFDDSNWNYAVPESVTMQPRGSQYFRKQFNGVANMAAYEIQLKFEYGIIAYINGKEVFREHMPAPESGVITSSTPSSGSFATPAFHGVIRPASEVSAASPNVLAVELHFSAPLSAHAITFDAYVAAVASSTPSAEREPCFIYPYAVSIASPKGDTPAAMFDFNKESALEASLEDFPITVTLQPSGPRVFLNSLRLWPSSEPAASVGAFSLEGRSGSSAFAPILSRANLQYEVNTYRRFPSYFHADAYQTFRLHLTAVAGAPYFLLVEMQPMTCNTQMPTTIQFSPSSYSVYANSQQLSIAPDVNEFSDCSIQPALPAGLHLDAASCVVSGKATAALSSTVFTVTSQMSGLSISGTFTLEVMACAGTLLSVLRTYKELAADEAFSLRDVATQQVVLNVALNGGQRNNQDWSATLCVTNARYVVSVSSGSLNWYEQSFLFVRAGLLGDEQETIARVRYEMHLGLPAEREINAQWAVAPQSAWQYKMGSVDDGWQTDAGWQSAVMGFFPASSNQIQLYKKTFNVALLEGVAGFVISLRYLYGCVIYLNGVEVFRNGVEGDLSSSSVGLNAYTDLLYRQISLPVKTMGVESLDYLQEGTNTIAIAIVAQTASQTTSVFDCAVRLALGGSRVFDYTVTHSLMEGFPALLANIDYSRYMAQKTCGENFWTLTFENNRREWISSVTLYLQYTQGVRQPRQFVLKARNTNLEAWTTLKNVTGMTWSLVGEHKRIWVENSQPWNQYRFENFGTGDSQDCEWKIGAIDLGMEVLPAAVPELAYSPTITVFKDVEMGEVYPNSEYFFDFAVTPALPEGITVDPTTGKISGTARMEMAATDYTITAKKVGGGSSTAFITLSVEVCTGGKSLITLVVRTDYWPHEASYQLHTGRGVSGEVIQSSDALAVPNGLNYADWCLPHALYTVELKDARQDGWANPAGWWLTVDLGAMLFEMGQMPAGAGVATSFSSLLPFQVGFGEWRLFNSENEVPEDWKAVEFDDSEWESVKGGAMGNHVGTTAYIRREVTVPSLEDYSVLNVRVKYTGGVVVYFNGRTVARFNLEENFVADSEALAAHDASLFSKFHVILSTVGAVAGKNVIAFEVHRSADQSTIVFDATGVFGVNDCSVVLDTFSAIDASPVSGCTKEDLLDLNPSTFGSLSNNVGSFIEWTVENLEGSKWNSFALQTNGVRRNYGFSLYARFLRNEEFTSALEVRGQETKDRVRLALEAPVGIAGFRTFKFVVDRSASAPVSVNAYVFQYCRAAGSGSCPGVGDFPAVGEGQISPAACAEGFRGYAYRECANGVLGDVKNDKCVYKLPDKIQYETSTLEFVLNTEVSSGKPTYKNIITEFFMQENTPLPEGLSIDGTTGEISGKPVREMEETAFTVRGKNPRGETFVRVMIVVRKGYCQPEGVFERTNVGEVAVHKCSQQGSYVGTQTRACVLGEKDGEWQKASGVCVSVVVIVVLVVVVVVIVAVVVLLAMKTHKRKAVGGVKGKKVNHQREAVKVWCVCFERV